jgi:hypothetical protein
MFDLVSKRSSARLGVYFVCSLVCGAATALAFVAFRTDVGLASGALAQSRVGQDGTRKPPASGKVSGPVKVAIHSDAVHSNKAGLDPNHQGASARVPVVKGPPAVVAPTVIARVEAPVSAEVQMATLDPRHEPPVLGAASVLEPSRDDDEWAGYEAWVPPRKDTYRTVCVRLCDGAFVPISFSTTRDRFKQDAAKCQSQCGSPSRLFVYKPTGSPDDMVDLSGQPYRVLPTAFKFRTEYDASCSCRSQPWETAALEQHRSFERDDSKSGLPEVLGVVPSDRVGPRVYAKLSTEVEDQPSVSAMARPLTPVVPVAPVVEAPALVEPLASPSPTSVERRSPPADARPVKVDPPRVVKAKPMPVVAAREPKAASEPVSPPAKVGRQVARVASPVVADAPAKKLPLPAARRVAVARPAPSLPVARSAVVRSTPVARPRSSVVASAGSRRPDESQRAFRGDEYWRLSVWEPRQ